MLVDESLREAFASVDGLSVLLDGLHLSLAQIAAAAPMAMAEERRVIVVDGGGWVLMRLEMFEMN